MLTNGSRVYIGMYGNTGYDIRAVIKEAKAFKDKPTLIKVIYPLQMEFLLHSCNNFKGKMLAFQL